MSKHQLIDWFAFTVHSDDDTLKLVWDQFFFDALGRRISQDFGGRGFERLDYALQGAKVYYQPVKRSDGIRPVYWHIELPAKALACLVPSVLHDLVCFLDRNYSGSWNVTRLDFAFDDDVFSPADFFDRACTDDIRTLAKRRTIKWFSQPFEKDEKGHFGTSGITLGSRQSERMLRVYDLHGFTRVELQMRSDRAHAVAVSVLASDYSEWVSLAKSHLLQYVTFDTWDVWEFFAGSVVRADMCIHSARRVSLDRTVRWIDRQVAVPLSVFFDVVPDAMDQLLRMVDHARLLRNRERYSAVLQLVDSVGGVDNLDPPDLEPVYRYLQDSF